MGTKRKSISSAYHIAAGLFKLQIEEIQRESLRLYLVRHLQHLKAEKFNIAKKYGISTSEEMEELYKKRELSEKDSWEDFFKLDNIEAEMEEVKKNLAVL